MFVLESELITVVDEDGREQGVATRQEVHRLGLWHNTFHCWIVSKESGGIQLYFQLRSPMKKDYPNLFDITAAGHLLADETTEDGVREVKEEIGLHIDIPDLKPLGIIQYSIQTERITDKERAHIFLLEKNVAFTDFSLQQDEVAGIIKVDLDRFHQLATGDVKEIEVHGFQLNQLGEREPINRIATLNDFFQHNDQYFKEVIKRIKKAI